MGSEGIRPLCLTRSLSAKLLVVKQALCRSPKSLGVSSSVEESPTGIQVMNKCPYSAIALHNPSVPYEFRMPLHYPRYTRAEYESMPEWQLDRLLEEYGLPARQMGGLEAKRGYAMGAFLWS